MNCRTARRAVEILVVDDNPGDVRLTAEALKDIKIRNRVHTVKDGREAITFLRRKGKHAHAPRPDLILLDLNMPRMDGMQVLAEIKKDSTLMSIPVVILTGSREMEDIAQSYSLNANCYVTKPIDLEQFITMVKSITSFWLKRVNRELRKAN